MGFIFINYDTKESFKFNLILGFSSPLNMGPLRGLPADFHSLLASTEACFKILNSSSHQNLKKFLWHSGT